MSGSDAARAEARAYVVEHELQLGSYGENLTSMYLHSAGIPFTRNAADGKRRINFAIERARIAIELGVPYYDRPDPIVQAFHHDTGLRRRGWVVMRLTPGDRRELDAACRVALAAVRAAPGGAAE